METLLLLDVLGAAKDATPSPLAPYHLMAERRYAACDPENRLIAVQLETTYFTAPNPRHRSVRHDLTSCTMSEKKPLKRVSLFNERRIATAPAYFL